MSDLVTVCVVAFVFLLPACVPAVKLRAVGGEAAGASSLAPKVGPLGLVRCRGWNCLDYSFVCFCLELLQGCSGRVCLSS